MEHKLSDIARDGALEMYKGIDDSGRSPPLPGVRQALLSYYQVEVNSTKGTSKRSWGPRNVVLDRAESDGSCGSRMGTL